MITPSAILHTHFKPRSAAQRLNIALNARRALAKRAALCRVVTAVVKSITFIFVPPTASSLSGHAIYAGSDFRRTNYQPR